MYKILHLATIGMNDDKIKNFTDLNAWREGHELVVNVYKITKDFPREEMFGLTSQLRRCSVSITSNISEGFSRNSSKEKIQFYAMALGSVTELQNQLLIAKDIGYLQKDVYQLLADKTVTVHKLINGLMKYLRIKASYIILNTCYMILI